MDIYAIISVVDVVFKLLILYLVNICAGDSLILYALFLFVVVCLTFIFIYFIVSHTCQDVNSIFYMII